MKSKKTIKFTKYVQNLKGFFSNHKKIMTKRRNENDLNESIFFKTMKEMMILNLKKQYVINYFKKDRSLRSEIETRSVAEYLSSKKKMYFLIQ